ncbi:MAG: hypothetical protein JO319_20550 [Acidobacteriaceae bacterium]|nr:hypothetical protein [Acidobacteriaceae bacterium]
MSKYTIASAEVLLVLPAALFMAALFLSNVQPEPYEPAHSAHQIVAWYAVRTYIGLWLFLIALPTVALLTGSATLLRRWSTDVELREATRQTCSALMPHLATAVIAAATLLAGVILAIVALHILTD